MDLFGRKASAQLHEINQDYDDARPYIEDAKYIAAGVAEELGRISGLPQTELVDMVVAHVYNERLDEARAALLDEYAKQFDQETLVAIIEKLRAEEGNQILAIAREQAGLNPQHMAALMQQARNLLQQEADAVVELEYTEALRGIYEAEKLRQIELNKYLVTLHQTTELDLTTPKLHEVLEHGDILQVICKTLEEGGEPIPLNFRWYEDSKSGKGWLFDSTGQTLYEDQSGKEMLPLRPNNFVHLNTLGHPGVLEDTIKLGLPLEFLQKGPKGYEVALHPYVAVQGKLNSRPLISDCKFITRSIAGIQ